MQDKQPKDAFTFQKTDQIGAAAAEQDSEFLTTCFVDTGDLALLQDMSNNKLIVLGRTGVGKSALFEKLKESNEHRVIELQPESLALTYLGNSTALNNISAIGINLDPFFSLLWRHIFTVEILKRYFQQYSPTNQTLWESLISFFTGNSREDREMQETIAYLREWGEEFWRETELRVKEITEKFEIQVTDAIKASLGGKMASVGVDFGEIHKLSAERKSEIIQRGQEVVSKAQVKDLTQVMKMLDRILTDRQKQFFLIVDRLDENWVEEKLRYRLIMALIQSAKDFIKVENAKVVIALRRDLIDRVFRLSRNTGFQEEKMESLYLQVRWTKEEILQVLDRRVQQLVRRRYTKQVVTYRELLPPKVHGIPIDDYIYDLATRPRDVIAFFNACIQQATNLTQLKLAQLSAAEALYSAGRLQALSDEWNADHECLVDFARILTGKPSTFKVDTITDTEIEDICLEILSEHPDGSGSLHEGARSIVDQTIEPREFIPIMCEAFYRVGLVGLKLAANETFSWFHDGSPPLHRKLIDSRTSISVSPPYIRALGVKDKVHTQG